MPRKQGNNTTKLVRIAAVAALVIAGILAWNILREPPEKKGTESVEQSVPEVRPEEDSDMVVSGTIEQLPEIDYTELDKDKELTRLMDKRKEELGVNDSLDMIVNSDESFKVGKTTVSMRDILEKSFRKDSKVFEERIKESGEVEPVTTDRYGIYVVQPGDNIWNVHFRIIQEYYQARGITVSNKADEPLNSGYSSGIGRLLKFSENMVIIYNLLEKKVSADINILEPLSKVVVYNMNEVFTLLEEINYDDVDKIRFDGETIWIPAQQPEEKG
ncbi:MAG: hypothetical protein GY737_11105 [Desulfobacteraceae bacterium]|nr:hypothetical protein [Desulfobacteraceae bacterium]